MTKKDFELIAKALKNEKPPSTSFPAWKEALTQWEYDCVGIANALRDDNPRFDRQRFLDACGLNQPLSE